MTLLILPGWGNSGPDHWQSHWERTIPGCLRVEQDDWDLPDRERWVARLAEAVAASPEPPVLVAHSLGCTTLAHWVAAGTGTGRVRGALLVAPPDVDQVAEPALATFRPVPRVPFPFPAILVASRTDPWMTFDRATGFAASWGARPVDAGEVGHLNVEAGFGPWPWGEGRLAELTG